MNISWTTNIPPASSNPAEQLLEEQNQKIQNQIIIFVFKKPLKFKFKLKPVIQLGPVIDAGSQFNNQCDGSQVEG